MIKDRSTTARYQNMQRLFIVLAIIPLIGTACTPVVSATPYLEPTSSATPSAEASPTKTSRPFVASPTATATITRVPAWTPVSTLSPDQAGLQFQKWLQGSQDCLLPCWGGITPGVTNWQEAKQILSPVVDFNAIHEDIECNFGPCSVIGWDDSRSISANAMPIQGYIYGDSNGKVYLIRIIISQPVSIYRLDMLLTQYGPPAKVFITATLVVYDVKRFQLILAYPDRQFIISYTWIAKVNGNNIISCKQNGEVYLSIKPIIGDWTDDLIKRELYSEDELDYIVFRRLSDVTDMSIDDFYKMFKIPSGNECIITPLKYWGG